MKITTILNAHGNTELVADTVDSIKTYIGNDIVLLVDGATWETWGRDVKLPVYKLRGYYHNYHINPYRNVALGLWKVYEEFPDSDWLLYVEYDVLIASDAFKHDLSKFLKDRVWLAGNDLKNDSVDLSLVEKMLNVKFERISRILGCCLFFNKIFLDKLKEISFFEKFLNLTSGFSKGFFPNFKETGGYDLSENVYPALCHYFQGKVESLASWSDSFNIWKSGNFRRYPMRFTPVLTEQDNFLEASIMHPVKDVSDPIRVYRREKRMKI